MSKNKTALPFKSILIVAEGDFLSRKNKEKVYCPHKSKTILRVELVRVRHLPYLGMVDLSEGWATRGVP